MEIVDKRKAKNTNIDFKNGDIIEDSYGYKWLIFYDSENGKFRYLDLENFNVAGEEYNSLEEMKTENQDEIVLNVELHILP